MPLITIEVTPDIAKKIRFLAESGVFAIKDGSATLYFKGNHLTTVKNECFSYAQIDKVHQKNILTPFAA